MAVPIGRSESLRQLPLVMGRETRVGAGAAARGRAVGVPGSAGRVAGGNYGAATWSRSGGRTGAPGRMTSEGGWQPDATSTTAGLVPAELVVVLIWSSLL
jgi:hypothetical protein